MNLAHHLSGQRGTGNSPWRRTLVLQLALIAVVLLVAGTQTGYIVFVLNTILLGCIGAIAMQVLQGTAGVVSVGAAAFILLGAFGTVYGGRAGLAFPLDVALGAVVAAFGGVLVALPALRLRSLYLALATLAAHFIAVFIGTVYQESVPGAGFAGFQVRLLFGSNTPATAGRLWAVLLLGVVLVVLAAASQLMSGGSGRALRMLREHETIAPVVSVPVTRVKLQVFALTAALLGVQGGLTAHYTGIVQVEQFTVRLAFLYVVMIVIGGRDSLAGAVVGAAVVLGLPAAVPAVVRQSLSDRVADTYGSQISLVIYGLLVILFVTASPDGLVGWSRGFRNRGKAATAGPGAEVDDAGPTNHSSGGQGKSPGGSQNAVSNS